jgi:hypothetical protein
LIGLAVGGLMAGFVAFLEVYPTTTSNLSLSDLVNSMITIGSITFLLIMLSYFFQPKGFLLFTTEGITKWEKKKPIDRWFWHEIGLVLGIRKFYLTDIGFSQETTEIVHDIDHRPMNGVRILYGNGKIWDFSWEFPFLTEADPKTKYSRLPLFIPISRLPAPRIRLRFIDFYDLLQAFLDGNALGILRS